MMRNPELDYWKENVDFGCTITGCEFKEVEISFEGILFGLPVFRYRF